jgi:polyisoprenoid-binding protein YceI
VTRFEIAVAAGSVRATFDPASLRVVCALRDGRDAPQALAERDRREIEATVARTVLDAQRHPGIRFDSTAVTPHRDGALVEGVLSIRGRERKVALLARRADGRAVVEARIHQPDFGIQPYTAMLGALKIRADVTVRLTTPWPDPEHASKEES